MIRRFFKRYAIVELLVSVFISSTLVFAILYIMFKISPDTAYISYEAENVRKISNIEAEDISGTIQLGRRNYNPFFCLTNFERITIPSYKLNYNRTSKKIIISGEEYNIDDIACIEIIPDVKEKKEYSTNIPSVELFFYENDKIYMFFGQIKNDKSKNNKVGINEISDYISISFNNGFGCFFKTDTNEGNYNHDGEFYIENSETGDLEFMRPPTPISRIQIINCKTSIVFKDKTKKEMKYFDSDIIDYTKISGISVNGKVIFSTSYAALGKDNFYYALHDVELKNVTQINSEGSGKINFSYSKNPSEFNLSNQLLLIDNKENKLNLKIKSFDIKNIENNNFYLNGTVKKVAMLSENNLFPSMKSWFRENIYLAPLALLTSIIGIFAIKPKENKNKYSDEELKHKILVNLNEYLEKNNEKISVNESKTNCNNSTERKCVNINVASKSKTNKAKKRTK